MTIFKPLDSDKNPLITVITICLNQDDYVEEAIESVLAQSYKNWELIFINDGSTDQSGEIAKDYASIM
jgi:glycosyltransferase involved in cell wall biosynthesis